MKKVLFLLVMVAAFVACSKDDDVEPSVANTQWEQVESGITATLSFFNETECKWELKRSGGSVYSSELYAYTYVHPKVVLKPKKAGLAVLEGTIEGNGMNLYNVSTKKDIGIYIKK